MTNETTSYVKSDRVSLNTLPPEIINQVFLNIDTEFLYSLKHVCSYWLEFISRLLQVQSCKVSKQTSRAALAVFEPWVTQSNGRVYFRLYQSRYHLKNLINKNVLNKVGNHSIFSVSQVDYIAILETLQRHARWGGAYSSGCGDVVGSIWQTVLGMTGSEYSVEEFRNKEFTHECVKSLMTKYTWYQYGSHDMMGIAWDAGIISLYPDQKTFSLLFATDTD